MKLHVALNINVFQICFKLKFFMKISIKIQFICIDTFYRYILSIHFIDTFYRYGFYIDRFYRYGYLYFYLLSIEVFVFAPFIDRDFCIFTFYLFITLVSMNITTNNYLFFKFYIESLRVRRD